MNVVQRLITAVIPKRWAAALEAESRRWMMRCPCGHERSVWEAGGIRYKAAGNPRRWLPCPQCGQATWHTVYHKAEPQEAQ